MFIMGMMFLMMLQKPPEGVVIGFMSPGVNTLDKRGSDVPAAGRCKCVPGAGPTRDLAPDMTRDRVLLRKGQSGNGAPVASSEATETVSRRGVDG